MTIALATRASKRLQVALAYSGWELKNVEIDTVNSTARVEVARGSLHVLLEARRGHASVSRERWETARVVTGRRGDRFLAERVTPRFLGRARFDSINEALHFFVDYVGDNGNGQLIDVHNVQLLLEG